MICQFEKLIYPQDVCALNADSYMVAVYKPCENVKDSAGNTLSQIKAVGYALPMSNKLKYDIQGHWSKNAKHGIQFEVENFNEVIVHNKEGIIAYLSSGQIKGIGPKLAERIYNIFGNESLEILDKEPEKLLTVSGITKKKLDKIYNSYLTNRGARDVIAFLAPYGITANRAVRLYKEYGNKTMEIVSNHPYRLCEMAGIGFKTADGIAMSMGFNQLSTERVDEGIIYTLADAESRGHLCMEKHMMVEECLKMLDTPGLNGDMIANRAVRLIDSGQLEVYKDYVYRAKTAHAETYLADMLRYHMTNQKEYSYTDLETEICNEETKLKVTFDKGQREAIKNALTNNITIITGGPGTGKTMIQRAILDIYKKNNPDANICCCAPTGRAARRMEESTGYSASTIHRAIGLIAKEDGTYTEPVKLDDDLVLVDEVSMLDIYIACNLFKSLKNGCQVVLVGDADQLPSVGPGAVLSEMIASGYIPVVELSKVFRQNEGSRIAENAKLIKHGDVGLDYGNDFQFIETQSPEESVSKLAELYLQETAEFGVDNVAMLIPFRKKTETGVNVMNVCLRDLINPETPGKTEAVLGKRTFRTGDKVMQTKNRDDVNNGDIGYIKRIYHDDDETTVYIDFGDGRVKEYDLSNLDIIDLGYASTVHKSQGSEYKSVIINLHCEHSIMLTRHLIYTAITRGKNRIIIVGERKALYIAIKRLENQKRGTCLAERLQEFM
jgi:exodeoxyribonuclease V alpha subunit